MRFSPESSPTSLTRTEERSRPRSRPSKKAGCGSRTIPGWPQKPRRPRRSSIRCTEQNTQWFEERRADLAELDALRAKGTPDPTIVTPKPVDLPKDLITKKDLDSSLEQLSREAVGFMAELPTLSLKHYQQFGEVLNIQELLVDPRVQKIGMIGVYNEKYKDQLKAKADAAQATRDEAIREEGRQAERARLASAQHPYPVVGNEPSALDAIEAARAGKTPEVKTLDAIAAEYTRLSATRAGAGA